MKDLTKMNDHISYKTEWKNPINVIVTIIVLGTNPISMKETFNKKDSILVVSFLLFSIQTKRFFG